MPLLKPLPLAAASTFMLTLGVAAFRPSVEATQQPEIPRSVSYAEHVAPILNDHCVSCHRPNQVAPFSLVGYSNAKKWASMVANVTESKRMPPWKAVHGYGEFQGENVLTDREIAILKTWQQAGAPPGDAKKEPKPPIFDDKWALGQPDLVVGLDKPFKVAAEGDDVYRNFVLPNTFDKPTWVTAMDIRPGNRKVVHHVILFIDNHGRAEKLASASKDGQEGYSSSGGGVGFTPDSSLGGCAPGVMPRHTPNGVAFLLKPGAKLVMQVHYHKTGKQERDQTQVGLYFAKQPIEREMRLAWIFNFNVDIPAGDKDYRLDRIYNVPVDVTLYGVMPHMHLLGRQMKAYAELPNGEIKPLVYVNDWDFNWQLTYALKEPMHLPKGTRIHVEAVYDNSAENPFNPNDPPKRVTWGEQTTDEMFLLIAAYTIDGQAIGNG